MVSQSKNGNMVKIKESTTRIYIADMEKKQDTSRLEERHRTKFYDYRMALNDSTVQHSAQIENMARQLNDLGEILLEITILAKILGNLPAKYNAPIIAWDSVKVN